jgi:hypothetical protein
MTKEFVPYELALKLKQIGFDMECFGRFYTKPGCQMFSVDEKGRPYPIKNTSKKLYTLGEDFVLNDNNVITAPLFQQVFRWFREEYNQHSFIELVFEDEIRFDYVVYVNEDEDDCIDYGDGPFETYEEAELACLDKLIEIVEGIESQK